MKISSSQTSVNTLLKIVQSNGMSANRRVATLSQTGRFSASIGFQPSTQNGRFGEREAAGKEVCDHRHYGYRTVSPCGGRPYATSAKISVEHLPLLSLGNTAVGQYFYQDEYSFIMASHCPVSSEQCEEIRLANSFKWKESPVMDLKTREL